MPEQGPDSGLACAGFRQLKLVRGARSITCFVEFSDVTTAMVVHNSQQVMRPSEPRSGPQSRPVSHLCVRCMGRQRGGRVPRARS